MGVLATFQAVYSLGESFVDQGTTPYLLRSYVDLKDNKEGFRCMLGNVNVIKIFFMVLFFAMLVLGGRWLVGTAHFEPWMFWVLALLAFATAFINSYLKLWVAQRRATSFALFQTMRSCVNVGASIILIFIFAMSWKGRIYGILMTELLFLILCIGFLLRNRLLNVQLDVGTAKSILKFGTPLFIYGIGHWVINLTDRFFLNAMVGVSATGIYSVGYSVGGLTELIAGGVGFAIIPVLFENLKNPSDLQKQKIVQMVYLYFIGLLALTLIWIFISPYLLNLFIGDQYQQAGLYIPWVAMAYFAHAIFRMFSIFITYTKKTHYLTYAVIAAAVVNVVLNYLLISANGAVGAAQATLIAFLTQAGVAIFFGVKVYKMPWLLKRSLFSLRKVEDGI